MKYLDELIATAKALPQKRTIAVCGADDEHVVSMVLEAVGSGLCNAILVGDAAKILEYGAGRYPQEIGIVDEKDRVASCRRAVELVHNGQAQVFVKGLVNTRDFLHAVLDKEVGLRSGRQLNVLSAYEIPGQEKLLFLADGGMMVAPTLEEKAEILRSCVPVLHQLGIQEPKVAILAANEQVSPKMQATVDAAKLVEMAKAGELPHGIYEGPMAFDVIMRKEAAQIKGIDSQVSGDADLILVPTIETGNSLGKAIGYFGKGVMAGIVVGATHPVIMSSRAAKSKTKIASIAWAILAYKQEEEEK